jgi:2-polyprenyl-3-methyl-5-hydroxy-6-metoxy-1,4-benzoquinol methylase
MSPPVSPLSKSANTVHRYRISTQNLRDSLHRYFGSACPKDAELCDYDVWECRETGLQFVDPLRPGNEVFYQWIAGKDSYYPAVRWEYDAVIERLPKTGPLKVADVGCGDGKFLRRLLHRRSAEVLGIDTLPAAVQLCRESGVPAVCGFLSDVMASDPTLKNSFDCVTAFHCLEHVPNPLPFSDELRQLLKPGGTLCISTPLSPMPFESAWFDPLNHAPHHISRWNSKAYARLAAELGMEIEFHHSKPSRFTEVLRKTFRYRVVGGPSTRLSRRLYGRLAFEILRFPVTFFQHATAWHKAEAPGSDGVLVMLRSKQGAHASHHGL